MIGAFAAGRSARPTRQELEQPSDGLSAWIIVALELSRVDISGPTCLGARHLGRPVGACSRSLRRSRQTGAQLIQRRSQGIDHRTVTDACTSNFLHAGKTGFEGLAHGHAA